MTADFEGWLRRTCTARGPTAGGCGLYVHIPFCIRKCRYCAFASTRHPGKEAVDRYLRALEIEISALGEGELRFETVYIGGGTPSLLTEDQLSALFSAIGSALNVDSDAEITVEANPETVSRLKADHLAALGVNRLSLGIQTFDAAILRRLGRAHSPEEALESFRIIRGAGFTNIGLDLIYGLPGHTVEGWEQDIDAALELAPEHLSLYSLSVEDGTALGKSRLEGRLDLPAEEDVIAMYRLALSRAAAEGLVHYEISSLAKPGLPSRHNSGCWTMKRYIGVGAGAHSFLPGPFPLRSANIPSVPQYVRRLESGESPVAFREVLDAGTYAAEGLMLGLRLLEGVHRSRYRERFGGDPFDLFPQAIETGLGEGWLEASAERLRLTPEGVLFSDEIFLRLF